MSSGSSFEFTGGQLSTNIKQLDARMDAGIAAAVAYHATRAVAYARLNAKWQDQTGNARNGLFGKVNRLGKGQYELLLGHSVPYGLWLEVRYAGRYAIIKPTIDHEGPELLRTLGQLFNTF